MGLFDTEGFDLSSLFDYLNPVGTAQAADTSSPGSPTSGAEDVIRQKILERDAAAAAAAAPPPSTPLTRSMATPVAQDVVSPPPTVAGPAYRLNKTGVVTDDQRAESGIPAGSPLVPPVSDVGAALASPMGPGGRAVGGGVASTGENAPSVMDARAQADKAQADKMAQALTLATALKGVQAPKAPEVQKISSPSVPRPTGNIKGGNIATLLQALNAVGQARRLPATLGRG